MMQWNETGGIALRTCGIIPKMGWIIILVLVRPPCEGFYKFIEELAHLQRLCERPTTVGPLSKITAVDKTIIEKRLLSIEGGGGRDQASIHEQR